jgi:hypothetical protein
MRKPGTYQSAVAADTGGVWPRRSYSLATSPEDRNGETMPTKTARTNASAPPSPSPVCVFISSAVLKYQTQV